MSKLSAERSAGMLRRGEGVEVRDGMIRTGVSISGLARVANQWREEEGNTRKEKEEAANDPRPPAKAKSTKTQWRWL